MLLAFAPRYFWGTSCFILSTSLGGGCQVIEYCQTRHQVLTFSTLLGDFQVIRYCRTGHQVLPDGRDELCPIGDHLVMRAESQNAFAYVLKVGS